jgi:hypothetical protein
METVGTTYTLFIYQITRRLIPGDSNLKCDGTLPYMCTSSIRLKVFMETALFFFLENARGHTWILTFEARGARTYHCSLPFIWPCVRQLWGLAWDAVLQDPVCGVKVSLMRVTVPWWGNRPFDFITRLKQGPALQLVSTWGPRWRLSSLLPANFRCNKSVSSFL